MVEGYAKKNSNMNNSSNSATTNIMKWPPPQLEIDWCLVTDVLRLVNKHIGGPERRRAAILERFYNKLDSRWSYEDFTDTEREILAIGVANNLAAHIVTEELSGRNLGKIKTSI